MCAVKLVVMKSLAARLSLVFCSVMLNLPCLHADQEEYTQVFRFDEEAEKQQWAIGYNSLGREAIGLSERFTTFSRHSLELIAPAWVPGGGEWPLWRYKDGQFSGDWSAYDRLLIDFVNPTEGTILVGIKSVDSATAQYSTGHWSGVKVNVAPRSLLRAVLPLEQLMRGVMVRRMDQSDIGGFLLYGTRPVTDFHLYVSNVTLLKPGQDLPVLSKEYVEEILDLHLRPVLEESRQALNALSEHDYGSFQEVREWAQVRQLMLNHAWEEVNRKAASDDLILEDVDILIAELVRITREAVRVPSVAGLFEKSLQREEPYVVAWASSMEKIIPREMPLDNLLPGTDARIEVARNESESIQIAVMPVGRELTGVRVEYGDFQDRQGNVLPSDSLDIRTVGYVHTRPVPYDADYSGWWPDPLLDFLDEVEIANENAQTFWLRVRPGVNQKAGVYTGTVRVTAQDAEPVERILSIHVRNFEIPSTPPIPITIPAGNTLFFSMFTDRDWDDIKYDVADFQADYFVSWDNLYVAAGNPDWDILEHLKEQGRLGMFNLYPLHYGVGSGKPAMKKMAEVSEEEATVILAELIEKIRPVYEEAKRRGLIEHAYFYGMDENSPAYLLTVKRISDHIKKAFPDVPIATTAFDFTYGERSEAENIDIWIPMIHEYKIDLAEQRREEGKSIWWYNCKTPAHPYPNQFTEYPAIEQRLMHGAMSAKYGVEGFLYYSFFRGWKLADSPERKAIDSGPYTDWDPCALAFSDFDLYNGEGYMAYAGPDGRPMASVRLENFRDGFEDLAWWTLLRQKVESLKSVDTLSREAQQWIANAESALEVPEPLIKSSHEFTLDPALVLDWRSRIGELIEQFPETR